MPPDWLWIPITIGAAFAQTVRNAAQRNLTPVLGTLGATLVRFLYGLPFALLWLVVVRQVWPSPLPPATPGFVLWVVMSAIEALLCVGLAMILLQQ